jgi:amino acid transporter
MVLASVMVVLPQVAAIIFEFNSSDNDYLLMLIFVLLLFTGILYLMLHYCLFKTDWGIDKLALDKNFPEENFAINMHRSTILKISIIVIGGFVIIDSLPNFCEQVFSYQLNNRFGETVNKRWFVLYAVKIIIGFLLIRYNRPLVNYIEYKRKK